MATRTILTSQPTLACDVCARRLLRGEHHDIFLAAGQERTVCELCAPRATAAGWLRARETQLQTLPPPRPRRGRSLIQRVLQMARASEPAVLLDDGAGEPAVLLDDGAGEPAVLLDEGAARTTRSPYATEEAPSAAVQLGDDPPTGELVGSDGSLYDAATVFNASEVPRRVAGVTRSLGDPRASVRVAEHLSSAVRIVVAWELCWYRYEVDLGDPEAGVRLLAQGSELYELERGERHFNARISASGELSLG